MSAAALSSPLAARVRVARTAPLRAGKVAACTRRATVTVAAAMPAEKSNLVVIGGTGGTGAVIAFSQQLHLPILLVVIDVVFGLEYLKQCARSVRSEFLLQSHDHAVAAAILLRVRQMRVRETDGTDMR